MSKPYQPVQINPAGAGGALSQATQVEQSRAVAEVQAAVFVAQQFPRDMSRATAEMRDVCGRMSMADRAFYAVVNRGNGPTVHLMRELARIQGNIDYGVRELHRDDAAGESEIQAYAWDIETNTRSTRTFIVPHARMAKGARKALTDLGDIYLNNQNIGARAVRECIATVLPNWLVAEAVDICHRTLEHGEGVPLDKRIADMVAGFRTINVSVQQIESKLGRKRGQWGAGDVAQMGIVFRSIRNGEIKVEDEFDVDTPGLSAADIKGDAAPPTPPVESSSAPKEPASSAPEQGPSAEDSPTATSTSSTSSDADSSSAPADGATKADPEPKGDPDKKPSRQKQRAMFAAIGKNPDLKVLDEFGQKAYLSDLLGRPIESFNDLSDRDTSIVLDNLDAGGE